MNSHRSQDGAPRQPLSLTTEAGLKEIAAWSQDEEGDYDFVGSSPEGTYFDVMAFYTAQSKDGVFYVETKGRYKKKDGTIVLPDTQSEVNCFVMEMVDEGDKVIYTLLTSDRTTVRRIHDVAVNAIKVSEPFAATASIKSIEQLASRLNVEVSVEYIHDTEGWDE